MTEIYFFFFFFTKHRNVRRISSVGKNFRKNIQHGLEPMPSGFHPLYDRGVRLRLFVKLLTQYKLVLIAY